MTTSLYRKGIVLGIIALFIGASVLPQIVPNMKTPIVKADDLDDGLVGYWNFNEGNGSIINDNSGHGNNGIISGNPQWVDGIIGTALNFDGNDMVTIPDNWSLNPSEITISCWVNFNRLAYGPGYSGTDAQFIICKGGDRTSGSYQIGQIGESSDVLGFGFELSEYWLGYYTYTVLPLETSIWYHMVSTYDGANLKIYIDGNEYTSNYVGNINIGTDTPLYFSYNDVPGFPYYLDGVLDEIKIYNRALELDEIERLYLSYISPKIISVQPSGKIKGPINSMQISFSQPMNISSFSIYDDIISFIGPDGIITIHNYIWNTSNKLEIFFSSQNKSGIYNIIIGSQILNNSGIALNHDFDDKPGEAPDDYFFTSFTQDNNGPRVTNYEPSGDFSGTLNYVDVWFSEEINMSTMNSSSIIIEGPNGGIIPISFSNVGLNSYRINIPSQTTYGQYDIKILPEVEDVVGNNMDQDMDEIDGESIEDEFNWSLYLVEVDLTILNVSINATSLWSGEIYNISWEGINKNGMSLYGFWTDAVYLSKDDHWDIDDEILTTVSYNMGLNENETYKQTTNALIPGFVPSDYFIIVRSDLYNQEKEGSNESNNINISNPISIKIRPILIDNTTTNILDKIDNIDYYCININKSLNFVVYVENVSDVNLEFYSSYEKIPTRLEYDYKSTLNNDGKQQILISNALPGSYYCYIYGNQLKDLILYNISSLDLGEIYLLDISPSKHGVISNCTMNLYGIGFNKNTTIECIGSDSSKYYATDINLISSSTMVTTLEVPIWPQDIYDVVVRNTNNSSSKLVDAFEVTSGIPYMDTKLIIPSSLGRHWFNTLWIEYENKGNSSIPAPIFMLHGSDDAILTLDSSVNRQGLWTYNYPPGTNDTVWFMGTGSGSTPGILQPGDKGRIPVYYLGLKQPWDFSDSFIEFDLESPISSLPENIDWDSLKDNMHPEWIAIDAWDAIWDNFKEQVGETWDDYNSMLNENMNYLASIGQPQTFIDTSYSGKGLLPRISVDIDSIIAFEFIQASGLGPYAYLSSNFDAYIPAPGLPIMFSRSYGQTITSRYELGHLGRGWRHNWDIYIDEQTNGDVIIHGPNGADRYFTKEGNNYKASPGDYGTLKFNMNGYCLTEKHGTIWQFQSDNLLDYVEDTNSNRITLNYTSGLLTSLIHSNGAQLQLDYNSDGRIWHLIDPRGNGTGDEHVTTFTYDASGEYLLYITSEGDRITNYTYEIGGTIQQKHALRSVEYPDGTHNYFTYDTHGRLTQTNRDGDVEKFIYSYDSNGIVTVKDALDQQTFLFFGLGGMIAQIRDNNGNILGLSYDDKHQLIQLTGPSGEEYEYIYDPYGNVICIEDSAQKTTDFTYDSSSNNLLSVTDARGNEIDYIYDSLGNLVSITYEDNTNESFTYDSYGNIIKWINRRGDSVRYTYDNDNGQITGKNYSDTPYVDFIYEYDNASNLILVKDTNGFTNMTYDSDTDWLTGIYYPGGQFFTFEYNNIGLRTKRTDQGSNIVNYIYDDIGQLDQITNSTDALIVNYDYDDISRLSCKTLGNGVYTTYKFDDVNRLLSLINHNSSGSVISFFNYTYDPSGQRTSMTSINGTFYYEYDVLGQLISVTYPDGHVVEYVYDTVGNRIRVIDDGVVTNYSTNKMNQYLDVGGISYTYDEDGNMIRKIEGGIITNYTYNIENRLVAVTIPADTWTYFYDAFNNRISSIHNGVEKKYIVDPIGLGNIASEYDNMDNLIARYDYGFGLLSQTDSEDVSVYYTFDAIGSTSELTNVESNVINNYIYDPFGNSIEKTEIIENSYQYMGENGIIDDGNGLNYMGWRHYTSEIGRFESEDPERFISSSLDVNKYNYVGNSPVKPIKILGRNRIRALVKDIFTDASKQLLPTSIQNILDVFDSQKPINFKNNVIDKKVGPAIERMIQDGTLEDLEERLWKDIVGPFCIGLLKNAYGGSWRIEFMEWAFNIPTDPLKSGGGSETKPVDPNDKIAPNGFGGVKYISENDKLMPYMIRFENQPNATGPAHIIRVTDALDEDLNLSTFELVEIAFDDQVISIPPGLNHYETSFDLIIDNEYINSTEIRCEIDVSLDYETRNLTFEMIGLDPDTGWLPEDIMLGLLYPNDDTGRGEGHISYLVEHNGEVPTGTEITNKARIYFDWNDPIDTPLVLNTIDANPPISMVTSLSEITTNSSFNVNWFGEDDENGSGIAGFDIYFSDNEGPFELWLNDTLKIEEIFHGEIGHSYYFYSIAKDNVGHIENAPIDHDTFTVVAEGIMVNDENPNHQMINVDRPPEELSISVKHPKGNILDVFIKWKNHSGIWQTIKSYYEVYNGTYNFSSFSDNDWIWGNTTYTWSVNVTDGTYWTNKTFTFTTGGSRYDVNNNDVVNFQDAGLVWIHRTSEVDYDGIYDVNQNGVVNFQDAGLTWVNRD